MEGKSKSSRITIADFFFSDSDLENRMTDLEKRRTGLHGAADVMMTVLEKGSLEQRLERCESQFDRLDKLINALSNSVGFSVKRSDNAGPRYLLLCQPSISHQLWRIPSLLPTP